MVDSFGWEGSDGGPSIVAHGHQSDSIVLIKMDSSTALVTASSHASVLITFGYTSGLISLPNQPFTLSNNAAFASAAKSRIDTVPVGPFCVPCNVSCQHNSNRKYFHGCCASLPPAGLVAPDDPSSRTISSKAPRWYRNTLLEIRELALPKFPHATTAA